MGNWSLNNREIVNFLNKIELNFDILGVKYNEVMVWPYLRQLISLRLINSKHCADHKRKRKLIKLSSISSFFYCVWRIYFGDRTNNDSCLTRADGLILIHASSRQERVDGKWYSRTSDSIAEFLDGKLDIATWEYSLSSHYPQPRYRPSEYIDARIFVYMGVGILLGLVRQLLNPKINHSIKNLNKVMCKSGVQITLPPVITVCKIYSILMLSKFFEKRLAIIKPKFVFIPEFYNAISMALSLACYRRNIASVEYQHGAQNDYHRMYTHWNTIPETGYEFLPKYFWCWGNVSADRIRTWAKKSSYHKVIIGGNLWMLKNQCNSRGSNNSSEKQLRHYKDGKKHILITLQAWPDYFNFDILSIMKESPSNWCWHIRQHPLHRLPSKDIKKYFLDQKIRNCEIEYSSSAPLYTILQSTDVHLTGFSTVAFEAQAYGIPTIFFHENALHGFSGLIDNVFFCYATSKQEIEKHMQQILGRKKESSSSENGYIVSSEAAALDALNTILD